MVRSTLLVVAAAATLLLTTSCASRGPFSGAVDGEQMFRVRETGASVNGGYQFLSSAGAEIGGCRVETTESPIEGSLVVTYQGEKCSLRYVR